MAEYFELLKRNTVSDLLRKMRENFQEKLLLHVSRNFYLAIPKLFTNASSLMEDKLTDRKARSKEEVLAVGPYM